MKNIIIVFLCALIFTQTAPAQTVQELSEMTYPERKQVYADLADNTAKQQVWKESIAFNRDRLYSELNALQLAFIADLIQNLNDPLYADSKQAGEDEAFAVNFFKDDLKLQLFAHIGNTHDLEYFSCNEYLEFSRPGRDGLQLSGWSVAGLVCVVSERWGWNVFSNRGGLLLSIFAQVQFQMRRVERERKLK